MSFNYENCFDCKEAFLTDDLGFCVNCDKRFCNDCQVEAGYHTEDDDYICQDCEKICS